jgi:metallo-beta-lactamase family protein
MQLTFLGATGTVTGSKTLVATPRNRILVDCGLFQGYKQLRLRNREPLPIAPDGLAAVVLTHAHIDHSGYLPLLVKNGFRGPIYCSPATRDLCEILLRDCAHLQEEEAEYANRKGYSKHRPALPLYTMADAELCLKQFHCVDFGTEFNPAKDLACRLQPAGHLLGAAFVTLTDQRRSLVFSGDLGRPHDLTMRPPVPFPGADYLILESTYGDRLHPAVDPETTLAEYVNRTAARGGVVVVPAFAVGRSQTILYCLHRLKTHNRIPDIPIYLDSPMAIDATEIFRRYAGEHRLGREECAAIGRTARYVNTAEESRALSASRFPMVLISASGMATGGRVLHHLKAFAPDHRNTILFTGYQAGGTRGASLLGGAQAIKIHGDYVPIRAEIGVIENLSSHADYQETLDWLRGADQTPIRVFLNHGEPAAADALRLRIEEALGWNVCVPEYRENFQL